MRFLHVHFARMRNLLVLSLLLVLLLFQAYAYYARFSLALGPVVILQPWLLQHGYLLYENIGDNKTPLMSILMSALIPFFSDGLTLAKIVLVVLLTTTTLLTSLATHRHVGWVGGLCTVFLFIAWSPTFGFARLWNESFLAPLYALSLFCVSGSGLVRSRVFWLASGLFAGIAILIKQHAILVVIAYLLWNDWRIWRITHSWPKVLSNSTLFCLAAVLPIAIFVISHYYVAGTLENLIYWTLTINIEGNAISLDALSPTPRQLTLLLPAYLWVPPAFLIMLNLRRRGSDLWHQFGWGFVLLVAASPSVFPRYGAFHLQASFPALMWLSILTFSYLLRNAFSSVKPGPGFFSRILIASLVFLWLLRGPLSYLFIFTPTHTTIIAEYSNLVPLSDQIRDRMGASRCFYIFPDDESLANLYYLTQCLPPRFWTFAYPAYMTDRVKRGFLSVLEDQKPDWIIYAPGRWGVEERAPEVMSYIQHHYQVSALLSWEQSTLQLLEREK